MTTSMVRCVTRIDFKSNINSGRNLAFTFDFVNEFDATDTWVDLTNQAKIKFPKNIYVRDENNNLLPLGGTTNSKLVDNLFRRGDSVSINFGYYTYDGNGNEKLDLPSEPIFQGYISKVISKKPIEIECEDNMWLLKQIACKPQVWPKDKTVEDLLKELLKGTDFSVNSLANTTIGDFVIQDESVAQLLTRLQKEYHLESYFRGNELRIGFSIYVPSEAKESTFIFQQNIISDNLEFQRKDDIKLSAVVVANNELISGTNKKGQSKTKSDKIEILVYPDKTGTFVFKKKEEGKDFPENVEGERRTLNFVNITDLNELFKRGKDELEKYYYTGFKGTFTTFAIPLVRVGDIVNLKDKVMPDRDGKYRVKMVKYTGGVGGHRQEIELHYKL
jgi:hypothetical protein